MTKRPARRPCSASRRTTRTATRGIGRGGWSPATPGAARHPYRYGGDITILADNYQGKPFNRPNGVIVKSDNTIWFTDPSYGIMGDHEGGRAKEELPRNVYMIDPRAGKITIVADDFDQPNGLCFSPDEKLLYITDTGKPVIRVYDCSDDNKLTNGRLFHDYKGVRAFRRHPVGRGRQHLVGRRLGRRELQRRERLRAGRHADRPHRAAGDCRQSLLRRPGASPQLSLHHRRPVAVSVSRPHARRGVVTPQ